MNHVLGGESELSSGEELVGESSEETSESLKQFWDDLMMRAIRF